MIIDRLLHRYRTQRRQRTIRLSQNRWFANGQIPWQEGYVHVKEALIRETIANDSVCAQVGRGELPPAYGFRIDERIVEYPWLLSQLPAGPGPLLDAGSTLNFEYLLEHPRLREKELSIYTYFPEEPSYHRKRVSYQYGDLRHLPYRDSYFQEVICQSTLEHIDMDNSLYGYELPGSVAGKSFAYLKVVDELARVLRPGGLLLLTFPYGIYQHHGFFQQFDAEMLQRLEDTLQSVGRLEKQFFAYHETGWVVASQAGCDTAESYNPHTGLGKHADGAAHSRAICCVRFRKNT